MIYAYSLVVPANTPSLSPVTHELRLARGIISRVEIEFPPGCAGLVMARVLYRERQIYPTNPEGYFRADGYTISFDDDRLINSTPYHVKLVAWSEDDTFPHTISFRFLVVHEVSVPSWLRRLIRM